MGPKEKAGESMERSAEKPTGPKGDVDAPDTLRVEKNKEVVLTTTPGDPPHTSSEHVSFALPL